MMQYATNEMIDGDNHKVLVYHCRLSYEASLSDDQNDPNPKLMPVSEFRTLTMHNDNRENVKFERKELPEDKRMLKRFRRRRVTVYRKDLKDVPADDPGVEDVVATFKLGVRLKRRWKKEGDGQDVLYILSPVAPGRPQALNIDKKGKVTATHHENTEER